MIFSIKCFIFVLVTLTVNNYVDADMACGSYNALKTQNIISPANPPAHCSYKIHPNSYYVCQVRIDFNTFVLAPPTQSNYVECFVDIFTAKNLNLKLCGDNSGQHVYAIHNITSALEPFTIDFAIEQNRELLNPARWNITVTQIDCPLGAPTREASTYDSDTDIEPFDAMARTGITSGFWVAPQGCLQYFPETMGQIKSFNFNNGLGPYTANLDYAICFRRTNATTRVRFTGTRFMIGRLDANNMGYDDTCYVTDTTTDQPTTGDYLFIPSSRVTTQTNTIMRASRYCGPSLLQAAIEVSPPGPIVLHFRSDAAYDITFPEQGFQLEYTIE